MVTAQVNEVDYYNVLNATKPDATILLINVADTKHGDDIIGRVKDSKYYVKNSHNDTLFNADDLNAMQKQFDWHKNITWQAIMLKHARLITEADIAQIKIDTNTAHWQDFLMKHGQGAYCHISIPLFSVNKKLCALYTDNFCGPRCGSGSIVLYRFKNGKWKYLQSIIIWEGTPNHMVREEE